MCKESGGPDRVILCLCYTDPSPDLPQELKPCTLATYGLGIFLLTWAEIKVCVWKPLDSSCAIQFAVVLTTPYYHCPHLCYLPGLGKCLNLDPWSRSVSIRAVCLYSLLSIFYIFRCQSLLVTSSHPSHNSFLYHNSSSDKNNRSTYMKTLICLFRTL